MPPYVYWLAFIPIIATVLVVHELGHYLAAKAFKVKTLEFGIGFPPRLIAIATGKTPVRLTPQTRYYLNGDPHQGPPIQLRKGALARVTSIEKPDGSLEAWSVEIRLSRSFRQPEDLTDPPEDAGPVTKHRGRIRAAGEDELIIADMEWSLNLIFIGAFVNLHEDSTQRSVHAINTKPRWQRTIVIAAGIIANIVFPIIPISAATAIHTAPSQLQIVSIQPGSPAQAAGIKPGDIITAVGRTPNPSFTDLRNAVRSEPQVHLIIATPGQKHRTVTIEPARLAGRPGPTIGVSVSTTRTRARAPDLNAITSTPRKAVINTTTLYREFYSEISSWFSGSKPQLAGIVGMVEQTAQVVETSRVVGFLVVTAVLSVNVGIVNLLPISPMDGGRLAMIALEGTRKGRPISRQTEMKITGMGLILIGVISVWLAIADVGRLIIP